ncbi:MULTISPECIES: hypothetical protein [Chromobacterium]|nr:MULTISPECIES: hypothetical protein [Chromobacterium]
MIQAVFFDFDGVLTTDKYGSDFHDDERNDVQALRGELERRLGIRLDC